jgi:hypothetical protein
MKTLPRSIVVLLALPLASMLFGSFMPVSAQNRFVFKSLADLDKCAEKNSSDTSICLESLQEYAKKHPKELFTIGKRARLHFQSWVALQFFEPALGMSPSVAKCTNEDVRLAIISGLNLSSDTAPNKIARRLLSSNCFTSVRPAVEQEIISSNGKGYLSEHSCPIFARKGVKISACEQKQDVSAVPVIAEKLPVVNIATAKVGIIKVYSGSEGERIAIADLPETPGAYLVRIDGVRSSINGKTMLHKEQLSDNGSTYWTEIEGKRWNTILVSGGTYKNYMVNVPGLRDAISVRYNEDESKKTSAASFSK